MNTSAKFTNRIIKSKSRILLNRYYYVSDNSFTTYNNTIHIRPFMSYTNNSGTSNNYTSTIFASLASSSHHYKGGGNGGSNTSNATTISASIAVALGLMSATSSSIFDIENKNITPNNKTCVVQCEQRKNQNHQSTSSLQQEQQRIRAILEEAQIQNRVHTIQQTLQKQQQEETIAVSRKQLLNHSSSIVQNQCSDMSTRVMIQATSSRIQNNSDKVEEEEESIFTDDNKKSDYATTSSSEDNVSDYSYLPHLNNIRSGRMLLENSAQQHHDYRRSSSSSSVDQQQPTPLLHQENSTITSHDSGLEGAEQQLVLIKQQPQQPTVQATSATSTGEPMLVERKSNVKDDSSSSSSVDGGETTVVDGVENSTDSFLLSKEEISLAEATLEEAVRKAKQHSGGLKIFSGNGNMSLALDICRHLGVNLGKATVGRFADGEVNVVIQENVRGKDVYVVQPTGPPVNDNIMELLLMVSTLRRSSARRITVVIPYYGYARQDRKMQVCLYIYTIILIFFFFCFQCDVGCRSCTETFH
jgi:predicted transposase YbfD/YdcC